MIFDDFLIMIKSICLKFKQKLFKLLLNGASSFTVVQGIFVLSFQRHFQLSRCLFVHGGHAKESLLVNVNCQRIEDSSSIALPWSFGQWNPSKEHQLYRGSRRKRAQWRWLTEGSHGPKESEREGKREYGRIRFPFPCDKVLWQVCCWQSEQ